MWEMLIALCCCFGMMGALHGYLKWYKHKYNGNKNPKNLSITFYKTGWKFRVLFISFILLMFYPVLLANGIYTSGGWLYYAPNLLLSWGKFAYGIAMGGILSVALNAYYKETERSTHVIGASLIAGGGSLLGSLLRPEWYIALLIWCGWLTYYIIKSAINNFKDKKCWNLYAELTAFYSVPTCLIVFILMNYFF